MNRAISFILFFLIIIPNALAEGSCWELECPLPKNFFGLCHSFYHGSEGPNEYFQSSAGVFEKSCDFKKGLISLRDKNNHESLESLSKTLELKLSPSEKENLLKKLEINQNSDKRELLQSLVLLKGIDLYQDLLSFNKARLKEPESSNILAQLTREIKIAKDVDSSLVQLSASEMFRRRSEVLNRLYPWTKKDSDKISPNISQIDSKSEQLREFKKCLLLEECYLSKRQTKNLISELPLLGKDEKDGKNELALAKCLHKQYLKDNPSPNNDFQENFALSLRLNPNPHVFFPEIEDEISISGVMAKTINGDAAISIYNFEKDNLGAVHGSLSQCLDKERSSKRYPACLLYALSPEADRDQDQSLQNKVLNQLGLDRSELSVPYEDEFEVAIPKKSQLIEMAKQCVSEDKLPQNLGEFFFEIEYYSSNNVKGDKSQVSEARRSYRQLSKSLYKETDVEELRKKLVKKLLDPYSREDTSLSYAFSHGGGNCQTQTKAVIDAIQRSKITLPEGAELGVQLFSDHIRPVLFYPKKNEVYDLVYGKTGPLDQEAPIFRPSYLCHSFLLAEKESKRLVKNFLIAGNPSNDSPDPSRVGINSGLLFVGAGKAVFSEGEPPLFVSMEYQPPGAEKEELPIEKPSFLDQFSFVDPINSKKIAVCPPGGGYMENGLKEKIDICFQNQVLMNQFRSLKKKERGFFISKLFYQEMEDLQKDNRYKRLLHLLDYPEKLANISTSELIDLNNYLELVEEKRIHYYNGAMYLHDILPKSYTNFIHQQIKKNIKFKPLQRRVFGLFDRFKLNKDKALSLIDRIETNKKAHVLNLLYKTKFNHTPGSQDAFVFSDIRPQEQKVNLPGTSVSSDIKQKCANRVKSITDGFFSIACSKEENIKERPINKAKAKYKVSLNTLTALNNSIMFLDLSDDDYNVFIDEYHHQIFEKENQKLIKFTDKDRRYNCFSHKKLNAENRKKLGEIIKKQHPGKFNSCFK
jgi:hypothetical protein